MPLFKYATASGPIIEYGNISHAVRISGSSLLHDSAADSPCMAMASLRGIPVIPVAAIFAIPTTMTDTPQIEGAMLFHAAHQHTAIYGCADNGFLGFIVDQAGSSASPSCFIHGGLPVGHTIAMLPRISGSDHHFLFINSLIGVCYPGAYVLADNVFSVANRLFDASYKWVIPGALPALTSIPAITTLMTDTSVVSKILHSIRGPDRPTGGVPGGCGPMPLQHSMTDGGYRQSGAFIPLKSFQSLKILRAGLWGAKSYGAPWERAQTAIDAGFDTPWVKAGAADITSIIPWGKSSRKDSLRVAVWGGATPADTRSSIVYGGIQALDCLKKMVWSKQIPIDIANDILWHKVQPLDRPLTVVFSPNQPIDTHVLILYSGSKAMDSGITAPWAANLKCDGPYIIPWSRSETLDNHIFAPYQTVITEPKPGEPWRGFPPPLFSDPWIGEPSYIMPKCNITFKRTSDQAAVPLESVSARLDFDSTAWAFSGVLAAHKDRALIESVDFEPVDFDLNINGYQFSVMVNKVQESSKHKEIKIGFSGYSPSMLLGASYQPARSGIFGDNTTAEQIVEFVLQPEFCGLSGWTYTWDLPVPSWLIPGGLYSYAEATPLSIISDIIGAIGGRIIPHNSEHRLILMSRYPVTPNLWSLQAADTLQDTHILSASSQVLPTKGYNYVFVRGKSQGVLAKIMREGMGATVPAPTFVSAMIMTSAVAREAGRVILDTEGFKEKTMQLTTPLPEQSSGKKPGLYLPGDVIHIDSESLGQWSGMVTAISIGAQNADVTMTLDIERKLS